MGLDYPGLGVYSILYLPGEGWQKHVINAAPLVHATGVAIGDLDDSGYADIVVAAKDGSECVVWYENPLPDPISPHWTVYDIDPFADGAREVSIGDLDGDNDMDVAAAVRDEDRVVWYAQGSESEPSTWIEHDIGVGSPAGLSSSTHTKPVPPPIDH